MSPHPQAPPGGDPRGRTLEGPPGGFNARPRAKRTRSARRAPDHALLCQRAPDRAKPYLYLGRLAAAEGRAEVAEKLYGKAVQLDPDCLEALRELRLIHMRREKSKPFVKRILRR